MKKTSILLTLCLSIIALSACGNKPDEPVGLEKDNSISELVEAAAGKTVAETSNVPEDIPTDYSILTTDDIIEQMKQGDFSNVEFRGYWTQRQEGNYESLGFESLEWIECDLNENGLKGLIMQDDTGYYSDEQIKHVKYIFALLDDQVICIWEHHATSDIYFSSETGSLMGAYDLPGKAICEYIHYVFDDELTLTQLYTLEAASIDDWYEEQMRRYLEDVWADEVRREGLLLEWGSGATSLEELIESYPERTTTGEYYRRYSDEFEELLTKQQFLDALEELSGYSFNSRSASDASSLPVAEGVAHTSIDDSMLTADDIIEQMKQGDFSNVEYKWSNGEEIRNRLVNGYDSYEWVECNLNDNGLKGLVWQDQSGYHDDKIKRIGYIFALADDQVTCIWANSGSRIIDFLSRNGNLIQNYWLYGTDNWDTYTRYIFDDELNQISLDTLKITSIDDWYQEQIRETLEEWWYDEASRERLLSGWGSDATSLEELIASYPERTTTGEYYTRSFGEGRYRIEETLTKQQFLNAFEEMTGISFYEVKPENYYMRDD